MTLDTATSQHLKAALLACQDWWVDMGVDIPNIPPASGRPKTKAATIKAVTSKTAPAKTSAPTQSAKSNTPDMRAALSKITAQAKAAPSLEALKHVITNIDAGALSDNARNIVFARGNPKADIMLIGEAPGRHEDESGLPFVGEAGQLLDKMLAAIGLDEGSVYITNICNWRLPGNRNPAEEELALCKPLITRHMELIAPKLIMIVGGVSLQALTGKTGIMRARGRWLELVIAGTPTPALPLYHPAFLLRRPELKKQAWHDLLAIKARLQDNS